MIKINLLPPEQKVKTRTITVPKMGNVVFFAVVGGIIALILIISLVQSVSIRSLQSKIEKAESEASQLRPQIEQIEKLTAEQRELNMHMRIITELEENRAFEVMLLDELNKRVPEHLWLTVYARSDTTRVTIEGVTFSNLIVADFMTRLERSVLYENVDLTVAQRGTIEERDVVRFSLSSDVMPE
ncbi:MAG: PilN domain-containing protein [Candidatus Eiseniibacteriota bacterium]|nr:MAG: PilN domain-containing protein [Candidatus Eisenbacteria bacterium]